jgi:adenosine deaminase/aminodeoxyfutalosine deaminase
MTSPPSPQLRDESVAPVSAGWIRRMPKAELHLHLEGSITPETWRRILLRHEPDSTPSLESLQKRYHFTGIGGFFDVFMAVTRSLREPEDYRLAAREAARALARQNVRYAELHTSVAAAHWVGRLSADEMIPAMAEGLAEAQAEGGPAWRLILDVTRDFCNQGCGAIALGLAVKYNTLGVAALGMGGTEKLPAGVARDVFAQARAEGLRVTAHAGEQAGPESIWGALEIGAERIGHATRATEDPALVAHLATAAVPLEMCPSSNVSTGAAASLEAHPLGAFFRRGMNVSLNTDDPPFFATNLCMEYERAAAAFRLNRAEVVRLARNAFEAAFLPEPEKGDLLREFDMFAAAG